MSLFTIFLLTFAMSNRRQFIVYMRLSYFGILRQEPYHTRAKENACYRQPIQTVPLPFEKGGSYE